jgi:serine/threonine protein kinase
VFDQHKECVATRGFVIDKEVGRGATSTVYCVGADCKHIIKIVEFGLKQLGGGSYDREDFDKEVAIHKSMSPLGITPKYVDNFTCTHRSGKTYGYLVMDYWEANKASGDQVQAKMAPILDTMKANDVVHGDLRSANVVVKDGAVALIDWGKAFRPSQYDAKELAKHVKAVKESLGIGKEPTVIPFDIDRFMVERL